jgi:hypothetical protein
MHNINEPGTSFPAQTPSRVYMEDLPYDETDEDNDKFCFNYNIQHDCTMPFTINVWNKCVVMCVKIGPVTLFIYHTSICHHMKNIH